MNLEHERIYRRLDLTRPAAMAPLDEAARRIAEGGWPQSIAESRKPVVAVTCNLTPLEMIHAAGGLPVRLCAGSVCDSSRMHSGVSAGPRDMPRDTCPVVKGMADRIDALAAAIGRPVSAVIVPATCDWKSHGASLLGKAPSESGTTNRADVPVRVLDLPRDKSPLGVRKAWREQIADLGGFIEQHVGAPVRRAALLRSIRTYQHASRLGRRLADLMKRPEPPLAGTDLMLVFNLFYSLPVEQWIDMSGALSREIESRGEASVSQRPPRGRARILIAGAPVIWPHFLLPSLIEGAGGIVASDALCSSYRGFSDLVSVDETGRGALLEALADRYYLPCTCPCFTPNEEYLWRIENQVRDDRIAGIVLHNLRNCYLFSMETKRLEEYFGRVGVPTLTVETDYESPAPGALATRIEAFIESLPATL